MGIEIFGHSSVEMFGYSIAMIAVVGGLLVALALAFEFVNGFHDTANAVTTVIYSKALTARQAILLSATFNAFGAILVGVQVAQLITKIVPKDGVSVALITAVLLAGLIWNLGTWFKGIPASSSHCLIGALLGAGIAAVGWDIVGKSPEIWKAAKGLAISPLMGLGLAIMVAVVGRYVARLLLSAANRIPAVNSLQPGSFEKGGTKVLQIVACAALSFSHGANDGQKMMGVIAMILSITIAGYADAVQHIPLWVMLAAAAAIGLGTAIGGQRIIKTVGEKLSSRPIDSSTGNAAQVTSAMIIFGATLHGMPVSTTHVSNSSVIGATAGLSFVDVPPGSGIGARFASTWNALNLTSIMKIVVAWCVTIPVCATMSAALFVWFTKGASAVIPAVVSGWSQVPAIVYHLMF